MAGLLYNISLSASLEALKQTDIAIVQGDVGAHQFAIRIYDGAQEIDYTSAASADIVFVKADQTRVVGKCTVSGAGISYAVGTKELQCPGPVLAAVQLWDAQDRRLTVAMFRFSVSADPLSLQVVESVSELPKYEALYREMALQMAMLRELISDPEKLRGPKGKQGIQGKTGATGSKDRFVAVSHIPAPTCSYGTCTCNS